MGTCFSSVRHEGQEKTQVRFSAGLETLLRDADLQQSSRGQSTQNAYSAGIETLLRDANDVQISNAKTTSRKTVDRKPSSMDRKQPSMERKPPSMDRKPPTSTRKSLDRKLSVPSIRKAVDGRPPSTTSTRKSSERRTGSTASTRRSLVGNTREERKLAEALGFHTRREDHVASSETERLGWQSLEHLLKKTLKESDPDGRKPMASYSPGSRPPVSSSPKVHADDRPRPVSSTPKVHADDRPRPVSSSPKVHAKMSPGLRSVPVGRKSVDRKLAERKPVERETVERKPAEWTSADGNSMERNTVDKSTSGERKPLAQRKLVERKSVDRKSVDRTFVDRKFVETVKSAAERKSFDRKSVDRKSEESVRAPVEHPGGAATSLNSRRSLDRVTAFSPDHYSKSIRKPRARNGYFAPDNGNPKVLPNGRQHRPIVDHRLRSSFADIDFLTQKFLIDNSEQAIQARIDASLSSARQAGQHDHTDPSYSSSDYRSAHQIDEFTKSCRESAAKAAARDLDSFKTLTSMDSSDSSGIMLASY